MYRWNSTLLITYVFHNDYVCHPHKMEAAATNDPHVQVKLRGLDVLHIALKSYGELYIHFDMYHCCRFIRGLCMITYMQKIIVSSAECI